MLRTKLKFTLSDGTQFNPHRKSLQRLAKTALDFSHQEITALSICEVKTTVDALHSGIQQLGTFIKQLDEAEQILNGGDHSTDAPVTQLASEIYQLSQAVAKSAPNLDTPLNELKDDLLACAQDAIIDFNQAKKKARQLENRLIEMTSRALAKGVDVDMLTSHGIHKTKWAGVDLFYFDTSKAAPRAGAAYLFSNSDEAGHCVAQHHAAKRCEQAQKANEQAKLAEAQRRDANVTAELKTLVSAIKEA